MSTQIPTVIYEAYVLKKSETKTDNRPNLGPKTAKTAKFANNKGWLYLKPCVIELFLIEHVVLP